MQPRLFFKATCVHAGGHDLAEWRKMIMYSCSIVTGENVEYVTADAVR